MIAIYDFYHNIAIFVNNPLAFQIMKYYILLALLFVNSFSFAQDCPQASGLSTDNYMFNSTAAFVDGHWDSMLGTGVQDFLIKYKEIDSMSWNNLSNLDSTSVSRTIGPLEYNTTYVWSVVAYCSDYFQDEAEWAVIDTFTTLEYVDCPTPSNLYVDGIIALQNNGFAVGNWGSMFGMGVDHFILNFKSLTDSEWTVLSDMDSTVNSNTMGNLSPNNYYEWRVQAYCSENASYYSDWSVSDTFFVGEFIPQAFSPEIIMTISTLECDTLTDINLSIEQDTNEPDIQSTMVTSNSGSFDFSNLFEGQNIGSATGITGINGFINNQYSLLVNDIISDTKVEIALYNIESMSNDGYFNIENSGDNGIIILIIPPSDNNSYTSGNSLDISLNGIFINPSPTTLVFSVNILSELGDNSSSPNEFLIECDINSVKDYSTNEFLYPNPATNYIHLDLNGEKYIEITDLSGRLVMKRNTFDNKINLSSLEKGIYIVHVKSHQLSQCLIIR